MNSKIKSDEGKSGKLDKNYLKKVIGKLTVAGEELARARTECASKEQTVSTLARRLSSLLDKRGELATDDGTNLSPAVDDEARRHLIAQLDADITECRTQSYCRPKGR